MASREHVKAIGPITRAALHDAGIAIEDVSAIAVTNGPGLPGSLLVGTHYAKGLAMRYGLPLYPVHHIEAHVYSGYLEQPHLPFPSVCLVVSGGHTSIFLVTSFHEFTVLGSTRDDAAGEAFDKISKMLGLGYPGGPHIDRLAKKGNPDAVDFPRGLMRDDSFDFSFSGLKTAVRYHLRDAGDEVHVEDVCASAQRAIVDVLVSKTMRAADVNSVKAVSIAGGVSANSELRLTMEEACRRRGMEFVAPRMDYCMDNAAMIGFLASARAGEEAPSSLNFTVEPRSIRAQKRSGPTS